MIRCPHESLPAWKLAVAFAQALAHGALVYNHERPGAIVRLRALAFGGPVLPRTLGYITRIPLCTTWRAPPGAGCF